MFQYYTKIKIERSDWDLKTKRKRAVREKILILLN